jgi:hypothetical protein
MRQSKVGTRYDYTATPTYAMPACRLQWLTEDHVPYLCALGQRRPDLVAVDRFCGRRTIVPSQQRDTLHGNAVRGQDRHEGVSHLPRHPVLAEACHLGDQAECADHVVRLQWRADRGRED